LAVRDFGRKPKPPGRKALPGAPGTFTLKDTGWVEAATRRKGKAKSKTPPLHNPQGWGTQILSSVTRLGHPPETWTWSIEPAGPAKPGQRISARTRALGKDWDVQITVASIDPDKRALDLTTQLPFGITVHNHIVCGTLDNKHCRVSFG
jgi:hypothetical protein